MQASSVASASPPLKAGAAVSRQAVRNVAYAALRPAAACLLTCLTAVIAIVCARTIGLIASIWVANGVAFVLWITARRSPWTDPAYALATCLGFVASNWLVGNTATNILAFTAADTLEVALTLWLARRLISPPFELATLGRLTRFVGVCLAGPLASSVIAGLFASFHGGPSFQAVFTTFYLGHVMGFAVVAPFLLCGGALVGFNPRQAVEFVAIVGLLCALLFGIMGHGPGGMGFLLYPALLLATVRFRLLGAATASLLIAVVEFAFITTWIHSGRIPHAGALDAIRHYQLYLIFGCLPTLFIAVVLDERDRFAKTAAQRQAEVEAAHRARSKLMENVSHEMRTPLNGIVCLSDLLTQEQTGPLSEHQKKLMQTLVGSARQLHELAVSLTDVARVETGDLTVSAIPFDLEALGREVCAANREILSAFGAQVVIELGETGLTALADPVLTRQIVAHLLTNAAKYAGHSGPITMRHLKSGAAARIEIQDHGPGISEDQRREVFEPFNRLCKTTHHAEGVGIGLAMSRKLAELQGGRLDFHSEPGKGACFWLELPAA